MNYPTVRQFQREKHGYSTNHLVSSMRVGGILTSVSFPGKIRMETASRESTFSSLVTRRVDSGMNT